MNQIGRFLGSRYEVLEPIGSGGMANVYKAKDHKLNRYVAVKILREEFNSDESFIAKFRQEAQAAASLIHTNVVNVYDVGHEDDSTNYIVMELCDGLTLEEYIHQKGKLEIFESINIAMQIASGIQAAHDNRIIHRDIKPQNVIITRDGKAKVTDFGIAKAASSQTISANTMGSVHYISPEQARGGVCDERSDIYSLGITMYEMLTGRVPFDGDSTVAVALLHIQGDIIPPSVYEPMIPVSLEKIIMKCTQKRPEQRYSSALELIEDLKKAMMTPNEDFVKNVPLDMNSGTKKFSEADIQKIREKVNQTRSKEEDDYQLDVSEEKTVEKLPEAGNTKETDSKFERVAMGIGIAVLIVIIIVAVALAGHAMNMFPSGDAESETQSETQSQESQLASNQTTMPDIEGRTLEEATKLLQEKSLGRAVTEEISDEYEPGYVIRAEYEAGTVLEKNTQVNIYVSKTPSTVTVPDYLIGNTESTVTKALEELGLKVKVEKGASGKVEKGEVYDTSPKAGEDVQEGDTVTIYVKDSEPVQMTEVPNLENRTESEAENLLEEAGLVGKSSSDYSDTVEEGKIISQDQEAGTSVPENTQISYVISKGSRLVKVPSVLTYEQEAGKALLISAGLSVGEITEEYNEAVSGTIISQSIDAEVEVARGSTINLVVSKGPEPIVVPDIIGEQESDALKTLEDAGLEGLCMEYRYSEEPKGTVIEIEPQEGSEVTSGQIIYYVLSDGEEDADDGNE